MASVYLRKIPLFMNILWSFISSRRFLARTLSTILCSVFVVVRPFSHFGGQSAYLAITVKELVFSAQENLPQQIEATFLHLVGGLTGIALSSFGKFLASLAYNKTGDTPLTRCIPALTLAIICFSGIYQLPFPIFLLTFIWSFQSSRLAQKPTSSINACQSYCVFCFYLASNL